MFKGSEDSSESDSQCQLCPTIQKNLIIDPSISIEHLICSICFHVLWDPVTCGSPQGCHNAFCYSCIHSWLQKSHTLCPTCKKPFFQSPAPPILQSVLQAIIIKCPNNIHGCTQQISYIHLMTHLRSCDYKILKCKGCKQNVVQKEYQQHVTNCGMFIVGCTRCGGRMTKNAMLKHSLAQCFSNEISTLGTKTQTLQHSISQISTSIHKLQCLTNCFLSGEPLHMNIQLYTSFNQHFIFPNPTLIKPSFNTQKQKFDFLHFYVVNPIYTDSIASIKWNVKINKMVGNILLGFCSSMTVNSIDYVINKYGDIKKKANSQTKYRLVRKGQGFGFTCGDVIKFRYVSLQKNIKIWNENKRVGIILTREQVQQLGERVYSFYSMDTLNDSISFI